MKRFLSIPAVDNEVHRLFTIRAAEADLNKRELLAAMVFLYVRRDIFRRAVEVQARKERKAQNARLSD